MKLNYNTIKSASIIGLVLLIICGFMLNGKKDANSPGVEFMPDMYRSPSVEVYGVTKFNGDDIYSTQFTPVKGTIARGYIPYMYPNNKEGYDAAGLYLKNPIPLSDKVLAQGEDLYKKNCVHCHGATGAGDGKVGVKLPGPPPAYSSLKITEGNMFHSITYGKGLMGNHASFLTQEERWKLVHYVQKLQGPKTAAPADSTKAPAVAEVKKEEPKH
jgi:mono/diheme cytochrome c family protein